MNRRRSMAFYVECLLLTVFLLALTAVLAQLFSAARSQALEARRLTDAQRLAQDVSEEWYAAADEADFWALAGTPAPAEGRTAEIDRTGPSGDTYRLCLYVTREPGGAGHTDTLHLEVCTPAGESLCRLEFLRYWPG